MFLRSERPPEVKQWYDRHSNHQNTRCTCVTPVGKFTNLRLNDSYASVIKQDGKLAMYRDGYKLVYDAWETGAGVSNCHRLYEFVKYCRKYYALLASVATCPTRRFFITTKAKVNEFADLFVRVQQEGWDAVVPLSPYPWQHRLWCPGGAGHANHTHANMSAMLEELRRVYNDTPVLVKHIRPALEARVCPDLAAHILDYYYKCLFHVD